jgi:hypothetical protein
MGVVMRISFLIVMCLAGFSVSPVQPIQAEQKKAEPTTKPKFEITVFRAFYGPISTGDMIVYYHLISFSGAPTYIEVLNELNDRNFRPATPEEFAIVAANIPEDFQDKLMAVTAKVSEKYPAADFSKSRNVEHIPLVLDKSWYYLAVKVEKQEPAVASTRPPQP